MRSDALTNINRTVSARNKAHGLAFILAVLFVSVLGGRAASAQNTEAAPRPPDPPLEVALTPYVWALALKGDAGVSGVDADVDVGFSDILDNLNGAVMLDGEVRKGDFGVLFDLLYANLSDNGASGDDRIKIDAELDQFLFNLAATYRLGTWQLADWQQTGPLTVTVDPYAGARYTYLKTNLRGRLDFPDLGVTQKRSVDGDKQWVDPMVGVRTIWGLGDRFEFVLAGDVGGISTSDQYSAEGFALAGYRFSLFGEDNARVLAGYRVLHQKYEDGNGDDKFKWDITMHGPIVGLSVGF